MNGVNKTLYIPLYGKAYVSRRGLFLTDKKAEEIWAAEGFELRGRSRSKWLAFYMGIRSAVFDGWLKAKLDELRDAVVIHIGCGMDARVHRVAAEGRRWYDVDFPEVIEERLRYYAETADYTMLEGDARDPAWLSHIKENGSAIVLMEGVSMYLSTHEMRRLTDSLCAHFDSVALLVDCYSTFAARMSKRRNPINDVGVTEVHGIDSPDDYAGEKLAFVSEHNMTPREYVNELCGIERLIFSWLYAGCISKKLYRLYEYKKA